MEDTESRLTQKIAAYHPSQETIQVVCGTPEVFLVGVSGAGKNTISNELMKTGKYRMIVSHTTRKPRVNNGVLEKDGVDYHFISLEQAEQLLDRGAYVEANIYGGNVYGTTRDEIQAAHDEGKIVLTDIEVQGVAAYMVINPRVKAVFIVPPSYQAWQERLLKRYGGNIDHVDYAKRMATARTELAHALSAPYFSFVVNDTLAEAVRAVDDIANNTVTDESIQVQARAAAEVLLKQLSTQNKSDL